MGSHEEKFWSVYSANRKSGSGSRQWTAAEYQRVLHLLQGSDVLPADLKAYKLLFQSEKLQKRKLLVVDKDFFDVNVVGSAKMIVVDAKREGLCVTVVVIRKQCVNK